MAEIDPSSSDALDAELSGLVEIARDIEQHTSLPAHATGADALSAVMCSVSLRLGENEVRELREALSPDLRAILQACAAHSAQWGTSRSITEQVAEHLGVDAVTAERTAAVVLEAVLQRMPVEAAERLAAGLPEEVRHPRAIPVSPTSRSRS